MRIVRDKRLLSKVGKNAAAETLRSAGNVIEVDGTARAAEQARIALQVYGKLADKVDTSVSAALRKATEKLVMRGAVDAEAVKDEAYEAIRRAISTLVCPGIKPLQPNLRRKVEREHIRLPAVAAHNGVALVP